MQINMTMTTKEYEMYRDFLKQRATLEANVTKSYEALLAEHLRLCGAVLEAFGEVTTQYTNAPLVQRFLAFDQTAAARAINLAKRALEP